jgi:hypothetical protein
VRQREAIVTTRPSTLLASIVLALAGVAVGVVAGRWSASRGFAEHDPVLPAREVPQDAASLDALRYSIDDLARALRERSSPVGASSPRAEPVVADRQPVPFDATAFDRLAIAVEHLDALLQNGAGRARPTVGSLKGPGFASLAAMSARADAIRGAHPDDPNALVAEELSKAHILWTRDDVVEHYGLPKGIQPNGDSWLRLIYDAFDDHGEHCDFVFSTRIEPGSLVTYVELSCNG